MANDLSPSSRESAAHAKQASSRAGPGLALRLLGMSGFIIGIAVLGTFIAATALLVYGAADTYELIASLFATGNASLQAKQLIFACIEITDIFLLATVLYIIAIGLYELFIDDRVPLPPWLIITDIDDLKHKLISVVIAVLGVVFLGKVISWHGEPNLQNFGIAIGAVVAALTYFLNSKADKPKDVGKSE